MSSKVTITTHRFMLLINSYQLVQKSPRFYLYNTNHIHNIPHGVSYNFEITINTTHKEMNPKPKSLILTLYSDDNYNTVNFKVLHQINFLINFKIQINYNPNATCHFISTNSQILNLNVLPKNLYTIPTKFLILINQQSVSTIISKNNTINFKHNKITNHKNCGQAFSAQQASFKKGTVSHTQTRYNMHNTCTTQIKPRTTLTRLRNQRGPQQIHNHKERNHERSDIMKDQEPKQKSKTNVQIKIKLRQLTTNIHSIYIIHMPSHQCTLKGLTINSL
eukprot:TRINITY_DN38916_c0_g1_i1.p1 TRINITY_DN38916_c0_g1~~TRINITY_DN38916_c0_g1_i1.p1  ORF type:complete len:310 (+),score=-45.45 TRINITY_DN38916_c0_g1_i1:100-930(+)